MLKQLCKSFMAVAYVTDRRDCWIRFDTNLDNLDRNRGRLTSVLTKSTTFFVAGDVHGPVEVSIPCRRGKVGWSSSHVLVVIAGRPRLKDAGCETTIVGTVFGDILADVNSESMPLVHEDCRDLSKGFIIGLLSHQSLVNRTRDLKKSIIHSQAELGLLFVIYSEVRSQM